MFLEEGIHSHFFLLHIIHLHLFHLEIPLGLSQFQRCRIGADLQQRLPRLDKCPRIGEDTADGPRNLRLDGDLDLRLDRPHCQRLLNDISTDDFNPAKGLVIRFL